SSMGNPITSTAWLSLQKSRASIRLERNRQATISFGHAARVDGQQGLKSTERFKCLLVALQKQLSRHTTDEHDFLVGAARRNGEAERLRSSQIGHQRELRAREAKKLTPNGAATPPYPQAVLA